MVGGVGVGGYAVHFVTLSIVIMSIPYVIKYIIVKTISNIIIIFFTLIVILSIAVIRYSNIDIINSDLVVTVSILFVITSIMIVIISFIVAIFDEMFSPFAGEAYLFDKMATLFVRVDGVFLGDILPFRWRVFAYGICGLANRFSFEIYHPP